MKVLILEDEAPAYRRLQNLISENHPEIEVVEVIDNIEGAVKWLKNNQSPELIFSDIQLSDGLSFEIYRQHNPECPIIFTTAFDEYMMDAFKTNGIDYLLKPVQAEELSRSIEKFKALSQVTSTSPDLNELIDAVTNQKKKYKERFLIKVGNRLLPVDINDVAYFLYSDGSTEMQTKAGKKYLMDQSLDDLENSLDPVRFYRLNRQVLACIDSIEEIHQYFKGRLKIELRPPMKSEVTVSREKASSFKNWING